VGDAHPTKMNHLAPRRAYLSGEMDIPNNQFAENQVNSPLADGQELDRAEQVARPVVADRQQPCRDHPLVPGVNVRSGEPTYWGSARAASILRGRDAVEEIRSCTSSGSKDAAP
jgi:hypothetical protein